MLPRGTLLICTAVCFALVSGLGVQFQESMDGYFSKGDLPYSAAYQQGQQNNNQIGFSLTAIVPDVTAFVKSSEHEAKASGTISLTGITSRAKTSGYIRIFDNNVEDGALFLHYYLAFSGSDGQPYHLEGFKAVLGNSCIDLEQMMTTLYVRILTGTTFGQGNVIATGIVTLSPIEMLSWVLSFAFNGQGTDADKMTALVELGTLLLTDLQQDCLNVTNQQTVYWYTWLSDGNNGYLLDLIQRPYELELRLVTYSSRPGVRPQVSKQLLPPSALTVNASQVTMGPMSLTHSALTGVLNNTPVDLKFALTQRANQFYPAAFFNDYPYFPNVASQYGTYQGGSVNTTVWGSGLNMAYTTYHVPVLLDLWQWVMISALNFAQSDLQIEVVATKIGGIYIAFSYVYYQGTEYHLNAPYLFETSVTDPSVSADTKKFTAQLSTLSISLSLVCTAPRNQFVMIEREGRTKIETSLLGTCQVTDNSSGNVYHAQGALLETKFS